MFVDEGDELLIGEKEYIVLNKYTEDGKKYIFVASTDNPEENIADNFDSDALELLLLSQDDVEEEENNTSEDTSGGFIQENPVINTNQIDDVNMYSDYSVNDNIVTETSNFFTVEKEPTKIEKILEIMFLK